MVCDECGSSKIQVLSWVDANTNEYIGDGLNESNDRWCEECKAHVDFKIKDDDTIREEEA